MTEGNPREAAFLRLLPMSTGSEVADADTREEDAMLLFVWAMFLFSGQLYPLQKIMA